MLSRIAKLSVFTLIAFSFALFNPSAMARKSVSVARAKHEIHFYVANVFYENKIKPYCNKCRKAAFAYNDLVRQANTVAQLRDKYEAFYLKTARKAESAQRQLNIIDKITNPTEQNLALKSKLEKQLAKDTKLMNGLNLMLTRYYSKQHALRKRMKKALEKLQQCEFKNCSKLSLPKKLKTCPKCRFDANEVNILQKDIAYDQHRIASTKISIFQNKRKHAILKNRADQVAKRNPRSITRDSQNTRLKKMRELRLERGKLQKQLNTYTSSLANLHTKLKRAQAKLKACEKKYCPKKVSYISPPPTSPIDNTYHTMPGALAIGILGNFAISSRRGSVDDPFGHESQGNSFYGLGISALFQYAFLSHPAWFVYGLLSRPGDHTGAALGEDDSERLQVIKNISLALGVAHVLLHNSHSSLSVGLGLALINQTLQAHYTYNNNNIFTKRGYTTLAPQLLLEALIPIPKLHGPFGGPAALMFGFSAAYISALHMTTAQDYRFKLHAGMEYAFLFGLKFSLGKSV